MFTFKCRLNILDNLRSINLALAAKKIKKEEQVINTKKRICKTSHFQWTKTVSQATKNKVGMSDNILLKIVFNGQHDSRTFCEKEHENGFYLADQSIISSSRPQSSKLPSGR